MADFKTYSPEEVIAENLQELTARSDVLGEQEIAHLKELAFEIAQGDDLADLLSSLPYYRISPPAPGANTLTAHVDLLSRSHSLLEARQCMILSKALVEQLHNRQPLLPTLFPDAEEISPQAEKKIIYQRSSYTDDAYLVFAALVPEARAAYAHSFHAACEQVYKGQCEYCILPIENAVEGELIGFAKLIAKYDLKIVACCDITSTDTSRQTRFALLQRNILPLLSHNTEKDGFFRFSIPQSASNSLGDVLTAAKFYDLSFISANTLPLDDHFFINLTFDIHGGDLASFLLYLAMVTPQYTPIGIYSLTQQKGK